MIWRLRFAAWLSRFWKGEDITGLSDEEFIRRLLRGK